VEQGYEVAVDLDLEKFFDMVNHDMLMSRLARRIKDKRVLASISRYIAEELKVNQQKSKVDKVWNCTYLGYVIGAAGKLRIAPASVKKLKAKIRLITRRSRPTLLREVIAELTPVIRGGRKPPTRS